MSKYGKRKDWLTALSGHGLLYFVKLVVERDLLIVVELEKAEPWFCFRWNEFVAYTCAKEEYAVPWDVDGTNSSSSGCTHMVDNSSWIQELKTGTGLLDLRSPNLKHFVIVSDEYVVQIISSEEPEIFERAPDTTNERTV